MNTAFPAQAAIDPGAFRACLGSFATGVTVMTCFADGAPQGVTANSFSSVSMDPPLVQWSIGRGARSFGAFTAAEGFAVNILAEGQAPLSTRFASKAEDKFAGVDWFRSTHGLPVLREVLACLECRIHDRIDAGDHVILLGEVLALHRHEGSPLLFLGGRYGTYSNLAGAGQLLLPPGDRGEAPTNARSQTLLKPPLPSPAGASPRWQSC